MKKTVEINTASISYDESLDLDFELSSYLMNLDLCHSIDSYDNKLVFIIYGIDIIIYNKFLELLKNKNLDFKEA